MGCLLDTNSSHLFLSETLKAATMMYDEVIWTHGSSLGHIYVVDAKGVTIEYIRHLNITTMKKLAYYVQYAIPRRLKGIHVINTSPVVEIVYNMIKSFLNKEIRNMVKFV